MVKIRLTRGGAKKRPFYHVVVTDQRNKRDGRYIERLGYFNPIATGGETPLSRDMERIAHWQAQGAQTSERVLELMKRMSTGNIIKVKKPRPSKKQVAKQADAAAAAVAAAEEAAAAKKAAEEAAAAEKAAAEAAPAEEAVEAEAAAEAEPAAEEVAAEETPAEDAGEEEKKD